MTEGMRRLLDLFEADFTIGFRDTQPACLTASSGEIKSFNFENGHATGVGLRRKVESGSLISLRTAGWKNGVVTVCRFDWHLNTAGLTSLILLQQRASRSALASMRAGKEGLAVTMTHWQQR